MELRLNKFISDSGYCSRREADRFIENRRVTLNGRVATLGDRVGPQDEVKVNGNLIENNSTELVYLALNKPVGITSTTDEQDRTNVVDFVNFPTRIFHIGRLDKDSEGLLMLTNDGNIVNKILRAGNSHEKEYEVWVDRKIDSSFVRKMSSGVRILGTVTKPCKVEQEASNMFRITLIQGLNRQIRRMCEELGYNVTRLRRVRIMNVKLGNLALGHWRMIKGEELSILLASLDDSSGDQAASKGAGAGVGRGSKIRSFKSYRGRMSDNAERGGGDSSNREFSKSSNSSRGRQGAKKENDRVSRGVSKSGGSSNGTSTKGQTRGAKSTTSVKSGGTKFSAKKSNAARPAGKKLVSNRLSTKTTGKKSR